MSTRLCLLQWLVWFLCFRFDALTELGAFMRTEFYVLRVASGPRVKLACCKSALTTPPPPPPSTPTHTHGGLLYWPFYGGGPGVSLILWCFAVYSAGRFVVCLTLCHFVLVFFSPFSIAITSLGEERANLSIFRMFDRFVFVWICRFPLPLGVWEGLRFVIVELPGLFSYLFFYSTDHSKAVVPVLVLLFVVLWLILRGNLFYVLPCVILFLCFQSF